MTEKKNKNMEGSEFEKKIEKEVNAGSSPLEGVVHSEENEVNEVKRVIKEIVSEILPDGRYRKIEKKLKIQEHDEKEAIELGFIPDNYYTAKEKEDEENELSRSLEGESGSHPTSGRSR